jgi:predicted enzyme related to lactoylglutathione lyase
MPHGKICYLEIPANRAEDSAAYGGGRVLTPRANIGPNMGAFAAFADPVGNEFGLYEEPKVRGG